MLLYAQTRSFDFVFEDLNDPERFFAPWPGWSIAFSEALAHPSRVLTGWSFALNQALWGVMNPAGYHAFNVCVHGVNGLLLMALLPATNWSLFVLGVYLLHPLQVETVAYVSARADLLLATWALMSVLALRVQVWLAVLIAASAVLVKESGVALVPLIALVAMRQASWTRERLVMVASVAACLAVVMGPMVVPSFAPSYAYTSAELAKLWTMAVQFVLPFRLSVDPDWSWITPMVGTFAVLLTVFVCGWAATMPRSRVAFGVAWVLLALSPRLGVPLLEGLHLHHLAVPLVGVALASAYQENSLWP